VLLVGLTYKPNTGDARESPATAVAQRLADLGAVLSAVDPHIAAHEVPTAVDLVTCEPEAIESCDVVVILTDHDAIDWDLLNRHAAKVLDTRNRLTAPGVDRL
jgi:UDP-N-acetyl-D-mannosaminuronic acid dehydrogenase/UDP-N-acetyl-D-glucosamine dehydrogenase